MGSWGKLAVGAFIAVAAGYFVANISLSKAVAAGSAESVGAVQVADMSLAEAITKRQELMKQMGGHMKAIKAFLDSNEGTAADVTTHAQAIQTASGQIGELFPAGTSLNDSVAKTAAKPEIWDKMDVFKTDANALGELAGKLAEIAATGDAVAIGDQFGNLGKNGCGACHSEFRLKTE